MDDGFFDLSKMKDVEKIENLGKRASFLLPSMKVYSGRYSKVQKPVAKEIHEFLLKNFGGYTSLGSNIYGYFKSEAVEYDELREFRVAFKEDEQGKKIPLLIKFLAKLAADFGEECIYLELGEDSFLVYPKNP